MKRFWPILKSIFIVWGFISFIGAAAIGSYVAYQVGPGNTDAIDSANKQDVRFVLNWCRLGDDRIEAVIQSYQSARSPAITSMLTQSKFHTLLQLNLKRTNMALAGSVVIKQKESLRILLITLEDGLAMRIFLGFQD